MFQIVGLPMVPRVSILIPHFQTPALTRLCLRLLRRTTGPGDYETIVIDNGSDEESQELLGKMHWIRLLRRQAAEDERPARSHGLALNLGVQHARSDLILVMHTDTMVVRADWLDFLVGSLQQEGPRCGSLGSWKMEETSCFGQIGKRFEEGLRRLCGRKSQSYRYIRSHCALYRREAIETREKMFEPSISKSAGEELHLAIQQAGYSCRFLPPGQLNDYVRHLNHATMALNREFGKDDAYMPRTRRRTLCRIEEFFQRIRAEEILADHSLDR